MIKSYIRAVYRLAELLGVIASGLLILLVLIIGYNVIMRYAFNASSIGLEELSWHFYAAIFLLGIPYALKHGAHVRVDLIYDKLAHRTQLWIDLFGTALFLIPCCLVIIWGGWQFTLASYQLGVPNEGLNFFQQLVQEGIGERSQDPGGLLNRWIIKGVIPFSFLCLLLTGLAVFLEKVQALLQHTRHSPEPKE